MPVDISSEHFERPDIALFDWLVLDANSDVTRAHQISFSFLADSRELLSCREMEPVQLIIS